MSIVFKPNGTLDIDTDPSDLPEESDGSNIVSGSMQRCKNLRLDEKGVLRARDGSYKLNSTVLVGTMDFIIEQAGSRYVFGGEYIYKDEVLISEGIQCEAPAFSPAAGAYAAEQTVTITSGTQGVTIYYTLDETTPSKQSIKYTNPISLPFFTTLKAIAVKTGWLDSSVTSGFYSATVLDFVTETNNDNMWSETDNNDFIGEGAS